MRPARSAVLLAAALVAGCGHPLLGAELEVPEIRMTPVPVDFPGAATALPVNLCEGIPDCLVTDVVYDLGEEVPLLDEEGVDVELRLNAINLDVLPGGGDLRGLQSIRVVLVDGAGGSTVLAAWTNPSPGTAPTAIHAAGNSGINLGPYLTDGMITVRVEASYDTTFPLGAFQASVEAVFSVRITVDYMKL
jgi:hypothetical protein